MNNAVWDPWCYNPFKGTNERVGVSTGTNYRQCPHGFHHPPHVHSCDGCWCEGESDRRNYGWPHNTDPEPA